MEADAAAKAEVLLAKREARALAALAQGEREGEAEEEGDEEGEDDDSDDGDDDDDDDDNDEDDDDTVGREDEEGDEQQQQDQEQHQQTEEGLENWSFSGLSGGGRSVTSGDGEDVLLAAVEPVEAVEALETAAAEVVTAREAVNGPINRLNKGDDCEHKYLLEVAGGGGREERENDGVDGGCGHDDDDSDAVVVSLVDKIMPSGVLRVGEEEDEKMEVTGVGNRGEGPFPIPEKSKDV